MTHQSYLAYSALKSHALYKADLLMKFHPESKRANLAQRGDDSDEEWPEEGLECFACNEDAPGVVQQ